MTNSSDLEIVPQPEFDPVVFWIQHKAKIIAYSVILAVAVISVVVYQVVSQQHLAESRQLFAQASSEDDFRHIIQKYPHTTVAENATLMLAAKLRDGKKYDEAQSLLQGLIDQNADYPLIENAWLGLAVTLEAAGKTDEALAKYQQTAAKFASGYSAPQALEAQAGILKGQGKLDDARRAYENVKSQYPNSYFAVEAMQELQQLKK